MKFILNSVVKSSAILMWKRNFFKFISGTFQKPVENMASLEALQKLEARASQAESLISFLKAEVSELQKKAEFCQKSLENVYTQRFEEVVSENEDLKKEIEVWKTRLVTAEKQIGVIGCSAPVLTIPDSPCTTKKASTKEKPVESKKKEKAKSVATEDKKIEKKSATDAGDDLPVDVRRLDIRVGKIINVKKHPAADTLYVEEVDLGENKTCTVVSGLVKYVPIEEMANRMVIVLCNLKPAKMRGITSEAMVLCASTPEKVEVLTPPAGSSPGDRVQVEGYPGEPDPILNPKKKIFETVAPDLKTDDKKVATYKGLPLTVSGKGLVTAESLTNVQIK